MSASQWLLSFGRPVAASDDRVCSPVQGELPSDQPETGCRSLIGKRAVRGALAVVLSVGFLLAARPNAAAVSIHSFSCAHSRFRGSGTDICTVRVRGADRMNGGWTVRLTGNNPAVRLPYRLHGSHGASRIRFSINIAAVSTAQSAILTADTDGHPAAFAITLDPVAGAMATQTQPSSPADSPGGSSGGLTISPESLLELSSFSCANGSLTGAATDTCSISLSGAAPSGGFTVALASNDSAVSVPGSVTVAAGSTSAGFNANVAAVSTTQTATITATAARTESTSLQLNAASAAWTIASTSVGFGNVTENTTATQSVSIQSTGTAALTISSGGVAGTGFSISGLGFPVTLNPGQTATLNIAFAPTTTSSYTGTVTLMSNAAAGGTATISLSGTGEAASYAVDLNWNAPSSSQDPVAGYDVYRAVSGSSQYQLLNASVESGTTYSDTTVQSGTDYTYYVVSVDASGNQSGPSNTYDATIP